MAVAFKDMSDEELQAYANEHLNYEIGMLRFCISEWLKPQSSMLTNAIIESFAAHARNLYEFLTNGEKGNLGVQHVSAGYSHTKTSVAITAYQKVTLQIAHLTNKRTSYTSEKLNVTEAVALYNWIEDGLKALAPRLRSKLVMPFLAEGRIEIVSVPSGTYTSSSYSTVAKTTTYSQDPPVGSATYVGGHRLNAEPD